MKAVIRSEFSTSLGAMFAASLPQLVEQLPGWRIPLAQPERRTIENPFTGDLIPNVLTRDPGPRTHPPIPKVLAFPCVLLPFREDWEQNYFALDLALSREPPLAQSTWEESWLQKTQERGLLMEPLCGGLDGVGDGRELLEVPARLVERLLQLRPSEVDAMAQDWLARCYEPADDPVQYLAQFCELAHLAAAGGQRLFSWNILPPHRERPGSAPRQEHRRR